MNVLVTGGTGFIGSKLTEKLLRRGHKVWVVTRDSKKAKRKLLLPVSFVEADLSKESYAKLKLEKIEAVVNLAGENIGERRWSEEEKEKILKSRSELSKNLINSLNISNLSVFLQASAIGFYPESVGDQWIDEKTESGSGFLSKVCRQWEAPALNLPETVRACVARFGAVLGADGGLLEKLAPLYRMGGGATIGDGKQWMSWIHIDDLVNFLVFSLENEKVSGTCNAVSPEPVRNGDFNQELAEAVDRPAFVKVPSFAIKALMGEKASLALNTQRVSSRIEKDFGFRFAYPKLKAALKQICSHEKLPPEKDEGFHYTFKSSMWVDRSRKDVFAFFNNPVNLTKVSPKDLRLELLESSSPSLSKGSVFKFKMNQKGATVKLKSKVFGWKEDDFFCDAQVEGPFKAWHHTHRFEDLNGGTLVVDEVRYKPPFGVLGDAAQALVVKRDLQKMFQHRATAVKKILEG